MNKGFTLIELLAVIIILAIIALIAYPIVGSIIQDAKKKSNKSSENIYIRAVVSAISSKNAVTEFNPQQCQILEEGITVDEVEYRQGDLLCDGINYLRIDTTGNRPKSGVLKIKNGKVVESTINY